MWISDFSEAAGEGGKTCLHTLILGGVGLGSPGDCSVGWDSMGISMGLLAGNPIVGTRSFSGGGFGISVRLLGGGGKNASGHPYSWGG